VVSWWVRLCLVFAITVLCVSAATQWTAPLWAINPGWVYPGSSLLRHPSTIPGVFSNGGTRTTPMHRRSGSCGRLLDADHDRLGVASVQGFEMEELMHGRNAVLPVLSYLFRRLEERFDGAPTLLMLDEAWVFLDDPAFAGRIREWLKTLRKRNVSVIFATQSLADVQRSSWHRCHVPPLLRRETRKR
jgi:hypothetical protein